MPARPNAEKWKAIRTAIDGGWGTTLRLTLILTAPSVVPVICFGLLL